ncbi:MAG: hypothetical protein KDA24_24540 [Deltaproteobacteria bacterium]|nr:hypothetical protein [Deltaproteobacteria bacterium]
MRKPVLGALSLVALAAGGFLVWSSGEGDPPEAAPSIVTEPVRPRSTPKESPRARRVAAPDLDDEEEPSAEPARELSFEEFPDDHKPEVVQEALAGMDDWMREAWPDLPFEWTPPDCDSPPCIFSLAVAMDSFESEEAASEVWRSARDESVRRLGYSLWGIQVDEGTDDRYHFWYFAMPDALQNGDTNLLNDYASNAMERRAELMGDRLEATE